MSITWVSADLRRTVYRRAEGMCEYCLIAACDAWLGCEVDHIVSEKHGGLTAESNLAVACAPCNDAKGSDIGSIDWTSGEYTRFFNPRTDRWCEHFRLSPAMCIEPTSPIGSVTARILKFNVPDRVRERSELNRIGRYPSSLALRLMKGRASEC